MNGEEIEIRAHGKVTGGEERRDRDRTEEEAGRQAPMRNPSKGTGRCCWGEPFLAPTASQKSMFRSNEKDRNGEMG